MRPPSETVAPFGVDSVSGALPVAKMEAGRPKTLGAARFERALWLRLLKPPPVLRQLLATPMELTGMEMRTVAPLEEK